MTKTKMKETERTTTDATQRATAADERRKRLPEYRHVTVTAIDDRANYRSTAQLTKSVTDAFDTVRVWINQTKTDKLRRPIIAAFVYDPMGGALVRCDCNEHGIANITTLRAAHNDGVNVHEYASTADDKQSIRKGEKS